MVFCLACIVLINERTHGVLLKPVLYLVMRERMVVCLACIVIINESTHGVLFKPVLYLFMRVRMVFCFRYKLRGIIRFN